MRTLTGRTAVVVDGHPLWVDAMSRLLEGVGIDVVATTANAGEVVELVSAHAPEVLVVGLGKGPEDMRLLEATEKICRTQPRVKVVMLAPSAEPAAVEEAFTIGVSAYCMKSAEPDDLAAAIRQSFEQSIFLAQARAASAVVERPRADTGPGAPRLTNREVEVLRLVAEGHSNSELARMLWVTEQTVKFHLSNIYRKLDVSNRTEASRWAQVHNLLPSRATAAPAQSAA